jgi:hypothetical protein
MRRSTTTRGRKSAARGALRSNASASLVDAWWARVLAGDLSEFHPVFGDVKVHLHGGLLRLSGELESDADWKELVRQARLRFGHGIDDVDVSGLTVASRREKPGILEQTLISAFPSRDAAEFARDFVIRHSRVVPKQSEIVDQNHADKLRTLIPGDFVRDARKALDGGHALLILRVDETEAFRVRELLEEDTRSEWTMVAPPELSGGTRHETRVG